MWLLIDDERNLGTDAVARNYDAAIRLLHAGPWEVVAFDHDLGECGENHYNRTGYQLVVYALQNELLPSIVHLVTSNPVGLQNMAAALKNSGYNTIDGRIFKKTD